MMVWWNNQKLRRDMIRKLETGKSWERYMNRILLMGENIKIFVSHFNEHQKVTSADEDFNNQMDKMTL